MTEEEYLDVAAAILDGTPVSWESLPDPETEQDRGFLQQLRLLSNVRRVHRDAHSPVGTAWGPLLIGEPLGIGTFGDVYKARDTALDRDVALKLLRSRAAGRHLAEGRALARVRHPNIVTVFGAAEHNGLCGIWMEFVEGETLAQLVERDGPLDAQRTAAIGVDICCALGAVHAAGILHGDIKAQNVMRESGVPAGGDSEIAAKAGHRVVLMDFGTGRVADDPTAQTLAGTPLYIAPEVLNGAPATASADIYAVGVLLYFVLTGTFPVTGRTLGEVRAAHQAGARVTLRERREDVPRGLAAIVERATSPDPALRFESALALADALAGTTGARARARARWIAAAALIAMLLSGVAAWQWSDRLRPARQAPFAFQARDWVLVAAFENRTADNALEGVVEAAIERELANSGFVNVVPRVRIDDTLTLMKKPLDSAIDSTLAREICLRDGGIRALLSGRVERIGQTYVLSAGLIEPASGVVVKTISEEASSQNDLAAALRRLANHVRAALGEARETIRTTEHRFEKVTTPSLQALRLYSESYLLGDRGEWEAALNLVRQAVAIDPDFASAHIWLAWTLRNLRRPSEEVDRAAARALQLADRTTDVERYWIVGSNHSLRGESDKAAAAFEAVLRLNPHHEWAASNLIAARRRLGQRTGFSAIATPIADARPNNLRLNALAMSELLHDRDFEAARRYAARVRALAPSASVINYVATRAWFVDAEEAWSRKDGTAAAAALDAAARIPPALTSPAHDMFAFRYMHYALALGKPRAAEGVSHHAVTEKLKRLILATTAYARGDMAVAREHARYSTLEPLRLGFDVWNATAWLKIRTGSGDVTQSAIDAQKAAHDTLTAELLIAKGQDERAIALLRRTFAEPPNPLSPKGGPYFRSAVTLAEASIRRGQRQQALDTLTGSLTQQDLPLADQPYWAMSAGLTLAELEAEMGRIAEARNRIASLTWQLAGAEPDFPLAVRLQKLSAAVQRHASAGPLTYEVTPSAIIATAGGGDRWKFTFARDENIQPLDQKVFGPGHELTNGDGILFGVLRTRRPDNSPLPAQLLWLDAQGRLKRKFQFSERLTFGAGAYGDPWMIRNYRVHEDHGRRRIAVVGHHNNWWPSFATILDGEFRRIGMFVNAGWVTYVHWLSSSRLLVSGFSNAKDGAMVALLDAEALDGQSPDTGDATFRCTTCGSGGPLRYVVMPRTEINVVTGSPFNEARLEVMADRVNVRTVEMPGVEGAGAQEAFYEFSPSLELVRASFSDRYWDKHRTLEREGKIKHTAAQCPDRNGPQAIQVWEPSTGWRTVKVSH